MQEIFAPVITAFVQKLERLMPALYEVTSDIAYLRFHGRNKNWFNTPVKERYDYLYSEDELKEFVPHIKEMSKKAKKTYLFFNNCPDGQSVKNAVMLRKYLGIRTAKHTLFLYLPKNYLIFPE